MPLSDQIGFALLVGLIFLAPLSLFAIMVFVPFKFGWLRTALGSAGIFLLLLWFELAAVWFNFLGRDPLDRGTLAELVTWLASISALITTLVAGQTVRRIRLAQH